MTNNFEALDLSHLLPSTREIALLPAEERIARIRGDRWIGYTRAQEAIAKLECLFTHPKKERMPNLLIVGPTNNGKTMIIEKFKRMHRVARPTPTSAFEEIPIVSVQMPSDPTIARFYSMLLYRLGAPVSMKAKVADLEHVAIEIMRNVSARILIIDEIHNLLAGRMNVQREFLNLIRFLGNELRIPIVCLGTRDAYLAIRTDDQLENRFEPHILPRWENDAEFGSLLTTFLAMLPLRRPSDLSGVEVREFILRHSEGTIGEISLLLTRAATIAIQSGQESLSRRLLETTDYDSPSERRRKFERELQG